MAFSRNQTFRLKAVFFNQKVRQVPTPTLQAYLHGGWTLLDFIPAVEVLEQMGSIEGYEQLFQDDGLQDNYVCPEGESCRAENQVAFSLHSWRGCQIVGDKFRVISVSASFCKLNVAWKMEYRVITEGTYCSTETDPISK